MLSIAIIPAMYSDLFRRIESSTLSDMRCNGTYLAQPCCCNDTRPKLYPFRKVASFKLLVCCPESTGL